MTDSKAAMPSWLPVATLTQSEISFGEHTFLDVEIAGDAPRHVLYSYYWSIEGGGLGDKTGTPKDQTRFGFIPPCPGTFIITVEAHGSDGVVRNTSAWVKVNAVDDVSMIFNIASEQFNSLKEYFIALARHELKFKEFRALNHVSFSVKRGEAFGLVGTNGSGKSTMLKIIAGVLEASEGTCRVTGTIAPLIELGAGFDMELTAKENIYLNGSLLGYRKEFIDEHFDDIVEFAELQSFMDMPLKNYSSGMVARIAFAIATITEPDILIVDETLSVGDYLFQQKCERRIQELVQSGNVTVLLVSHSIELVERICNRVCWIEKGQMRMVGPTDEICEEYKSLGK